MTVTISVERTAAILKAFETGKGLDSVTMGEYLQVSFLTLMSSEMGDHVDVERTIVYGGNVFLLHACVSQVVPGQQVSALRNIV